MEGGEKACREGVGGMFSVCLRIGTKLNWYRLVDDFVGELASSIWLRPTPRATHDLALNSYSCSN